ncbi:CG7668 [Drosophila busckii]|uniref:CG7668 n=1 Tax=Drosophila busckii TaxID=30019 RepID=A0A0M4ECA6_DROBS|nr:CG7668 [Drosophila busckii]
MESTIKNFQANAGALRKCASLSRITEEELERVLDKIHKLKTRITTLKDTNTNLTEPTSCVSFGNDIQTLRVPGTEAFQAPCDYKFAGEGWTVIQRRVDDSVNFNRTWEEYTNGFGDLRGNFWLGLEKLHLMTKLRRHELYIQLENFQNETRYARYSDFTIGNEAQSYELLTLGDYSGNAGDALSYHQNIKFSTQKRDNDNYNRNCAVIYSSAVDSEVDCKNQREDIQKELVEYKAKIDQMKSTIKNLQANPGALRECASLSGTTEGELERVLTKIHKLQTTITTLKATNNIDCNKQMWINPTEQTRCVTFGVDIQTLRVPGAEAFQVPCDSKFAGPGWAVIQRRVDDSVSFNRTWEEYGNGFGDLRGNFWLGLERLHMMTKLRPHELYIQLEDFKNEKRYAHYSNFSVGNEAQSYKLLSVGEYSGNAGNALDSRDGLGGDAKNMKFSTPERDNNKAFNFNCAAFYASGWWFNRCSLW